MCNITLLDLMDIARDYGCEITVTTGFEGCALAIGVKKGGVELEERWYAYDILNGSRTSTIMVLADIMSDIKELSEKGE